MKVIELTRGKVAIVDDDDFERLSQWRWQCNKFGYALRLGPRPARTRVWMHHVVLGENPKIKGMDTDHINGNRSDNRKCNLRIVSRSQNNQNRRGWKKTSSGVKGVRCVSSGKGYFVQIGLNGKYHYFGKFDTIQEAKEAHDKAILQLHGEFARLS